LYELSIRRLRWLCSGFLQTILHGDSLATNNIAATVKAMQTGVGTSIASMQEQEDKVEQVKSKHRKYKMRRNLKFYAANYENN